MTNSQDLLIQARQGATLVTASRRLSRTLRQRYNEWRRKLGDTVWPTPEILPWEAWLETLWEAHLFGAGEPAGILLSRSQELAMWRRIIERATGGDALLDTAATADAAANSWQLLRSWRLDRRTLGASAGEDTVAFLGWADEFERVCGAGGWLDHACLLDRLTEQISAIPLPPVVLLAGFEEISPQQQRFFDACREVGARIVFDEQPSAPSGIPLADARGSEVPVLSRDSEPRIPLANARGSEVAVCVSFRESREEIEAAARWSRRLLEAGANGPIGVVVLNLSRIRDSVERIFTEILHPSALLPGGDSGEKSFNISVGRPLRAYPIVRAALSILELEPGRNESTRIGRLLRSRHLSGGDSEWTARAALDARIRRDAPARISMDKLAALAAREHLPLFARALERWWTARASLASSQKPSGWSHAISLLLEAFGWPGDRPLDSREYQVLAEWNGLLSELARLDAVVSRLRYRDALQELKRAAADAIFQPEGPAAPIQILGMLEASGLHFEHLWIAGLHDDAWPAPARPDPFLPIEMQRRLQMPHASPERELEFARSITERLLASAGNVVVSYPIQDADGELGPSPLIQGLRPVAIDDLPLADDLLHRTLIRNSARLESVVDEQGPSLAPDTGQQGGTRVFQLQAACPFRAYAELRLGARALEPPRTGLDERDRGTLVHLALEKLWRDLRSHERLVNLPPSELTEIIECAVDHAIESFGKKPGGELTGNLLVLERLRLNNLLAAWLEIETRRMPFDVIQPEGERYAELGGVQFRVRPDRIDRVADGREAIVDYKTGNVEAGGWDGPRPESPQLPLYAVTHTQPLAGLLFGQVRVGAHRLIGIGDSAAIAPGIKPADLEACRAAWRETLIRLGQEFGAGRAAVDPKDPNKTCRICKLHALCRVREMNAGILGGEED